MQLDLSRAETPSLLGAGDPPPVIHRPGSGGILLTVEHAGRTVPAALADMGLAPGQIDRHIGWDIGAFDLAENLAARLDATLIAQRYSRLVIDCNRPWEADDLTPEVSDRTAVPANAALSDAARRARWDEIHTPFHAAVSAACDTRPKGLVSVHSYDPRREVDAGLRPWPVGLLFRRANPLAEALRSALAADQRALPLGLNAPYEIEDASDYTIPVHGEGRGIPHVLLEVRNDFLRDARGIAEMADMLAGALDRVALT